MFGFDTAGFLLCMAAVAVVCYFLGSIKTGIVLCRILYKTDVRSMGSGSGGMTNVLRNFGKKGAALALLGDVLKGVLAVFAGRFAMLLMLPGVTGLFDSTLYGAYIAAIFVIVGDTFPLYFGFKGGKGIATTLGVVIALQPILAAILLSIFLVVVLITRIVSLGSIIAIILYAVSTFLWCQFGPGQATAFSTTCACIIMLLVLWMHRENIKRLMNGTEYKFGQKRPDETAENDKDNGAACAAGHKP